jgi:hypothetical protein
MTDEGSEIIDFYPENFKIDLNGKKQGSYICYYYILYMSLYN